jgi:hypothetical protein
LPGVFDLSDALRAKNRNGLGARQQIINESLFRLHNATAPYHLDTSLSAGEPEPIRRPIIAKSVAHLRFGDKPAMPDELARCRARALGLAPGVLPPGSLNAITDVAGARVAA